MITWQNQEDYCADISSGNKFFVRYLLWNKPGCIQWTCLSSGRGRKNQDFVAQSLNKEDGRMLYFSFKIFVLKNVLFFIYLLFYLLVFCVLFCSYHMIIVTQQFFLIWPPLSPFSTDVGPTVKFIDPKIRAVSAPPGPVGDPAVAAEALPVTISSTPQNGTQSGTDKRAPPSKLQKQKSFTVTTVYTPPSNPSKAMQKLRAKTRAAKAFKSTLSVSNTTGVRTFTSEYQSIFLT